MFIDSYCINTIVWQNISRITFTHIGLNGIKYENVLKSVFDRFLTTDARSFYVFHFLFSFCNWQINIDNTNYKNYIMKHITTKTDEKMALNCFVFA